MQSGKKIIRNTALVYLIVVIFFAWGMAAGRHKIFPWKYLAPVYKEVQAYFSFKDASRKSARDKILLDRQEIRSRYDYSGFQKRDASFHDGGYLLISRYSSQHSQVIVELFSIADERVLHTWIPPLAEIFSVSSKYGDGTNTQDGYRTQHPLLFKDGGLVFTSGEGAMVRTDACGGLVWVIDRQFHHSIETDHLGNIIAPIVMTDAKARTVLPIRDDGFATVSIDGQIIDEYSVTDMLIKNGYRVLIYGIGDFKTDRIHLNDAQPILRNQPGAGAGDIILSARNISTVFLFDPQSGKIKWLKTGPWLNQHDVNPLENGTYSIFGNDVVMQRGNISHFVSDKKISDIYIYNPIENEITQPYTGAMVESQIGTETAGRSTILGNGDVFIEESDRGRLLRISINGVRWEYVNGISQDTVGAVHWSRYISENEIDLAFLENLKCN